MFILIIQNLIGLVIGFVGLGFHVADKPVVAGFLMFATFVIGITCQVTIVVLMITGKFMVAN